MLKSIKALAAGAMVTVALSSSAFATSYGHHHSHHVYAPKLHFTHHVHKHHYIYHSPVCVQYGWAVDYHGHKKWVCLLWK